MVESDFLGLVLFGTSQAVLETLCTLVLSFSSFMLEQNAPWRRNESIPFLKTEVSERIVAVQC